jgi:hypothetical protein
LIHIYYQINAPNICPYYAPSNTNGGANGGAANSGGLNGGNGGGNGGGNDGGPSTGSLCLGGPGCICPIGTVGQLCFLTFLVIIVIILIIIALSVWGCYACRKAGTHQYHLINNSTYMFFITFPIFLSFLYQALITLFLLAYVSLFIRDIIWIYNIH